MEKLFRAVTRRIRNAAENLPQIQEKFMVFLTLPPNSSDDQKKGLYRKSVVPSVGIGDLLVLSASFTPKRPEALFQWMGGGAEFSLGETQKSRRGMLTLDRGTRPPYNLSAGLKCRLNYSMLELLPLKNRFFIYGGTVSYIKFQNMKNSV